MYRDIRCGGVQYRYGPSSDEDLWYINSLDISMTSKHKLPIVLEPGEQTIFSFDMQRTILLLMLVDCIFILMLSGSQK